MRLSLLTSMFPAVVALMMTAGFALASLAPGDTIASDDATSPELTTESTTAPGDHGPLPATPAILVHARLRLTSTAADGLDARGRLSSRARLGERPVGRRAV